MNERVIEVNQLYAQDGQAKLSKTHDYENKCLQEAGQGTDVVLTGAGPIWLYLRLAHALHGKARSLYYDSPVTGRVKIFDHNPY